MTEDYQLTESVLIASGHTYIQEWVTVCNERDNPVEVTIREVFPPKVAPKKRKKHGFGWALKQMRKGKKVRNDLFYDGWYWYINEEGKIVDKLGRDLLHFISNDLTCKTWTLYEK
jgi:hypothetical protein